MLFLGYKNDSFTDGLGAQFQRIFSIYALARFLNCHYYHTGLSKIDYHGLIALENDTKITNLVEDANQLLNLTGVGFDKQFVPEQAFFVENPTLEQVIQLKSTSLYDRKKTLLLCHTPYSIMDRFPSIYRYAKSLLNYEIAITFSRGNRSHDFTSELMLPKPGIYRVAVHVRRGEIMANAPSRLLSDEYYLNVIHRVRTTLQELSIPYELEIHSELPTRPFSVNLKDLGKTDDETFDFDQNYLRHFERLEQCQLIVNQHPLSAFLNLATADILIGSRSSFSYTAGIAGRNLSNIMPRFWHGLLPDWIDTDSNTGEFDKNRLVQSLESKQSMPVES